MTFFALSGLLIGISSLSMGIFVYLKGKNIKSNKVWILFTLAVAIWGFGGYQIGTTTDINNAFFWWRVTHIGIIFIPVFFIHYVYAFLDIQKGKLFLVGMYLLGFIFLLTNFTNLFIANMRFVFSSFYYDSPPGPIYPFFVLFFFVSVLYAHFKLLKRLKTTSGLRRNQLKYFFFATIAGFLGGGVSFLPVFGIDVYPYSNLTVALYPIIMSYAIVRYRLMDIHIVITQSVAYGAVVAIFTSIYIGLMVTVDRIFTHIPEYKATFAHSILFIGVLFVLIYVLPRMKTQAVQITRKTLFRGRYDYQQELGETARTIPAMLNLEQLGNYILSKIKDTMKVEKLALFVYDEDKHSYRLATFLGLSTDILETNCIAETSALIVLLKGTGKPIVQEELEKKSSVSPVKKEAIVKQLNSLHAELLLPLMLRGELRGFITLSAKQSQEMFTDEDLSLLTTLANQVALTIEYIKAIDKISSERRYVGLGKAAMRMAHDIKNPLVPLKTFLQVLPDKYPKEFAQMAKADEEFTGSLYQSAIDGVNRINLLVERALHFARHPLPQFAPVALNELLDNVLMQEDISIKKAKVQLQKQYTSDEKTIEADAEQLIELFSNLISNAVDAMENTSTKKMTISIQSSRNYITVGIADTGCGISQDKIDSIFDPFITYKHKGSGLGLAIVKRIVEEHHGTVAVNSEPNQGTSFQIMLPKEQKKTTAEETGSEKANI